MIDAVIDEDRQLLSSGRNSRGRFAEEQEKFEYFRAKTVVALVGRAVEFFAKERSKLGGPGGAVQRAPSKPKSNGTLPCNYDYSIRLEVHLLIGLSGPDLGVENTIAALRDLTAELDGLVPPLPKNVRVDPSDWKPHPASSLGVDRRVDVRLHVLLRLDPCRSSAHLRWATPCSGDETGNKELLESFVGSYSILEKLYEAEIIHGLGLDGMHGDDILYLLKRCKVRPQLYRGDVAQALDIIRGEGINALHFHGEEDITATRNENITFLASNVAGHVLQRRDEAPNAYMLLQNLGGLLFRSHHEMLSARGDPATADASDPYFTVPRVVMSFLVRHEICVLPHAHEAAHLADDAPESVLALANFLTERRAAEIGVALAALLSEEDLPEDHGLGAEGERGVAAVFRNPSTREVHVFRVDENDGVAPSDHGRTLRGGGTIVVIADTGDKFAVFGSDGLKLGTYTVIEEAGGVSKFLVDFR